MKIALRVATVLLCLAVCVGTARAQGQCTLQNIAGYYALTFTGATTVVNGVAPDTMQWDAYYGPIAGAGAITINRDGTANGFYWLVAGAWNFGLTKIPWEATVELNADCTGTFHSSFNGAPMSEHFVVLGNGMEIRSVATETAHPLGNWLTVANRITGSCKQQKVTGTYLFQCKNIFPLGDALFGGAIHILADVAANGDYTGMVYGKVGPMNQPFPVGGYLKLNEDCTAEGTLASPALPAVSHATGVFFDEGKQGYWMPLSGVDGNGNTVLQPYGYCTINRIGNK